jgi:DNA transposition AAA+ family ATPase
MWFLGPAKNINQKYAKGELGLESKKFQDDAKWRERIKAIQELAFVAVPLAAMVDSKTFEREVLRRVLVSVV